MDRSRLEKLVERWLANALRADRDARYNPRKEAIFRCEAGTYRECAEKLESLLKDSQDNDELTVAYMVGREDGRKGSQGEEDVSEVTRQLIERDKRGREKYGVTLDRTDLSLSDWLQHMAEELMDAAGYALAAKREATPDAVQLEKRAREILMSVNKGYLGCKQDNELIAEGAADNVVLRGDTAILAVVAALAATPEPQRQAQGEQAFKNFHRSLCARFGYTHDDKFWWRDLVSLEEHIAALTEAKQQDDAARERDLLAEAIANAGIKCGLLRPDIEGLTGPQLLMIADDMAEALNAKQQGSGEAVVWQERWGDDEWTPITREQYEKEVTAAKDGWNTLAPGHQFRALGVIAPQGEAKQQAPEAVPDDVRAVEKARDGWKAEAESLRRDRDYWRTRADLMNAHKDANCWYWQGDEHDYPQSMANDMCVVIRADQLRAVLAATPAASGEVGV